MSIYSGGTIMKELVFQVKFLSDIVLPASSNTEGNISQLDFIPGSNFLGMVAKEYDKFENSFDIFHSGKVRFGDATLLHENEQTYKIPLSYFHKKLDDSIIYNHHHNLKNLKELGQLKQLRNGYITKNKKICSVNYNYSQKSGYDKEKRRSKDSSMYGYNSIQSGTVWQFNLRYHDISETDANRIKSNLIGKKRLGKSKSSQYGQVEITLNGKNEEIQDTTLKNEILLYVNSRLALHDENANLTLNPLHLISGLKDENIVWEKCQIKTSSFTPYNGARQTKDYERAVINNGSVIVLKDITPEQLDEIKQGVGANLSEGFGEILINPSFLKDESFSLVEPATDQDKHKVKEQITKSFEDTTVQFLANRHNELIEKLDLATEVQKFIDKNKDTYPKKMNSQWGTIRSLCMGNTEENIKEKVEDYISNGIAKDKWEGKKKNNLLDAIEKTEHKLMFTKLLAMQMPKIKELENAK